MHPPVARLAHPAVRRRWQIAPAAAALLTLTGLAQGQSADALPCPTDDLPPERGQLCLQLRIQQGRAVAAPGAVFVARGLPAGIARQQVLDRLQTLLAGLAPRCDGDVSSRAACLLPADAALHACVGDAGEDSSWGEFWGKVVGECGGDIALLDRLRGRFGALAPDTPFVLGDSEDAFQPEPGLLRLQIVAYTRSTPIGVLGPLGPQRRLPALRAALAPLEGGLWDGPRIAAALTAHYLPLGLQPQVFANVQRQRIEIIEAAQVQGLSLPSGDDAAPRRARMQAAYLTLEDADYRRWLAAGQRDGADFVQDLGRSAGDEPFWLEHRIQRQRIALQALGMELQAVPARSRPAPAGMDAPQQLRTIQVQGPATGREAGTRFIGIELSYRPGQGLASRGVLRQDAVATTWADLSAGVKLGRAEGADTSSEFEVSADYIGFETLQRRLGVQASVVNDTTPGRHLRGLTTDEKRHGRQARLELEAFRERAGQRLVWQIERQWLDVRTGPDLAAPVDRLSLSSWKLGAAWTLDRPVSLRPWTLSLHPSWLRGRLAGGGPAYRKLALGADGRVQLDALILDLSAAAEHASAATPLVEQPSLGGAASVRGFPVDEAIGRTLWKLQSELWWPVPRREGGAAAALLAQLRLATFVDVAGLRHAAAGARAGVRHGAGVGLRMLFDPAVVKLDYGWGRGPGGQAPHKGRFYFDFTTDLAF